MNMSNLRHEASRGKTTLIFMGFKLDGIEILAEALEHERYYGFGMDALAWMLWSWYAVEHDRFYGLGMDAPVIVCSRT